MLRMQLFRLSVLKAWGKQKNMEDNEYDNSCVLGAPCWKWSSFGTAMKHKQESEVIPWVSMNELDE